MTEDDGSRTNTARTRVLPETELLDELDAQKDLEHAKSYIYKVCQAAEELSKMGPVVAGFGERIHRLAEDAREAVTFLEGRSYFEVKLYAPSVRATSGQEAARILGEEASLSSRWEPYLEIDEEIQRIPWTEET